MTVNLASDSKATARPRGQISGRIPGKARRGPTHAVTVYLSKALAERLIRRAAEEHRTLTGEVEHELLEWEAVVRRIDTGVKIT